MRRSFHLPALFIFLGVGLATAAAVAYSSVAYSSGQLHASEVTVMTNPSETQPPSGQVQTRPDGSKVYTHSNRVPDNTRTVTQEYAPDGTLRSAHIVWTGFAGKVLDVNVTFDASGKVVKEDGYRAPDLKTPISELILPLPAATAPTTPAPAGPIIVPKLGGAVEAAPAAASTAKTDDLPDGLNAVNQTNSGS